MLSPKARAFWRKIGVKLIALAFILIGMLVAVELTFRPVVETVNAYECHAVVSEIINDAVMAEIERENTDYSKLVTLSTNSEGEVISLESNVMNINRLKTGVAQRVEREIDRISAIDIQIPIGTLAGIQLLHGKGFNIGMSVKPVGYAMTTIISEFSSAGINQTRHRMIVRIEATVDAVIPGFSTKVPISTDIVAAETIIVGRVPDAYTHVVASDNDLVGLLEDYGAGLSD